MSVIKIQLDKPMQEFEIGGKVYEVYYDDESLKKYEKQTKSFYEKVQKKLDLNKATEQQLEKYEKEQYCLLKETLEVFFGKGSFDEIYQASGKSLINLTKVVTVLVQWLGDKTSFKNEDIKKYYTK